ncbi:MAG: 30S ribosomal protein S17e [Candidatus Thermoplasmatota archaeon]|jgi:small subunit ribosomal protein S17e|nr:30S ribosomal protein S17e [Candidatus Thermoplasmatota archaeon]MCL5989813.1 30S ribosomal protein S17e [Candidatus Thermoplasmatota archaeon]
MGSIRPSNVKRIAEELVDKNQDLFNESFDSNKELLKTSMKDASKKTVNAVAGYVTRYVIKKRVKHQKEVEEGSVLN